MSYYISRFNHQPINQKDYISIITNNHVDLTLYGYPIRLKINLPVGEKTYKISNSTSQLNFLITDGFTSESGMWVCIPLPAIRAEESITVTVSQFLEA